MSWNFGEMGKFQDFWNRSGAMDDYQVFENGTQNDPITDRLVPAFGTKLG